MTGTHAQVCKSTGKIENINVRSADVDGGQKKALNSLELVLSVVVNYLTVILQTKIGSLGRAVYTLNCRVKSLASRPDNFLLLICLH